MQAPSTYQPRRVVTNWPAPRAAEAAAANGATAAASTVGGAVASPFELPLAQVAREAAAAAVARAGGDAGADVAAADAMEGVEGDKAAPAVDVTKHNFEAVLPAVREYLGACDFFALDCEMTGLFLDGQQEGFLDDMQDRYTRTAAAAHQYVINQFGLSCFKRQLPDGPGGVRRYTAATFNFYLFPRPAEGAAASATSSAKRFLCDAGSLAFLAGQGFDFNRCIYDGVPFMPVRQRDDLLRRVTQPPRDGEGAPNSDNDVALTKPDDIAFVQGLLAQVNEWLATNPSQPLDLPPVNRYLRLLSYQALAKADNFPSAPGAQGNGKDKEGSGAHRLGFYVQKTYDDRGYTRLRLLPCATAAQAAALEAEERRAARAEVHAAAGFAAVFEAMRDCGRPAVGHNCMFDLAYAVAQFGEGRLPATWEAFKDRASSWFRGGVYDTKHVCRQLPALLGDETSLGTMYKALVPQGGQQQAAEGAGALPAPVSVTHAPGFEKYLAVAAGQLAHEAGYDALMTGSVFVALEAVMQQQQQAAAADANGSAAGTDAVAPYASVVPYVWRLNVTRSDLPYALLRPTVVDEPASLEPVPERPTVFWLGPLSPGVRANDIHRRCEEAGLGKVRITFLAAPANSCLVELQGGEEAAARARAGALVATELSQEVLSYRDFRARKDAALLAGTWPLPGGYGYGGGYRTGGYGGGGAAGAAGAAANGGAAGDRRPVKRSRTEMEAPPPAAPAGAAEGAEGHKDGLMQRCTIM